MRITLQDVRWFVSGLLVMALFATTALVLKGRSESPHIHLRRSKRSASLGRGLRGADAFVTMDEMERSESFWIQSREYETVLEFGRDKITSDADVAPAAGDSVSAARQYVNELRSACLEPWSNLTGAQQAQRACQQWALHSWPGNGVIIYRCTNEEGQSCGGLGDRVRGMVFMYWLAVLRRAAFFVDSQRPTKSRLEVFWKPAELNWILPKERRAQRTSNIKPLHMIAGMKKQDEKLLGTPGCSPLHFDRNVDHTCQCLRTYLATMDIESAKVLQFSTTHHHKCMAALLKSSVHLNFSRKQWSATLNYLFTASPLLKSMARKFQKSSKWSPSRSVCLHLRGGGPIGPAGYEMGDNARTQLTVRQRMYKCAATFKTQRMHPGVHKGFPMLNKTDSYLIIADHDRLVSEAKAHLHKAGAKILSTSDFGPMLHIDKVDKHLLSQPALHQKLMKGEKRAYLDHYLLGQCQYVVVDSSGFAWTALNYAQQKRIVLRPVSGASSKTGCHESDTASHL